MNAFILSRLLLPTLSVTVILTYGNVSPVLMMKRWGSTGELINGEWL
ncbi:hypothetical protein LAD77_00840 [Klebsiella pneumoniae]|nr:hypothetical protein [Klebsiella pneumoniae]